MLALIIIMERKIPASDNLAMIPSSSENSVNQQLWFKSGWQLSTTQPLVHSCLWWNRDTAQKGESALSQPKLGHRHSLI